VTRSAIRVGISLSIGLKLGQNKNGEPLAEASNSPFY
jgi:hypothetical protein